MFEKISNKLKSFLSKKYEEYFVRVEPHQFEKIEKAIKDENAELWARVERLEKENRHLKLLLEQLRDQFDEEVDSELKTQEAFLKEIQKRKRYFIPFKLKKPLRLHNIVTDKPFRDNLGNEYPYLRGIEFEDRPNGTFVYAVLSQKPHPSKLYEKEILGRQALSYLRNLYHIIYDPENLMYYLKRGVIYVNLDDEGRYLPISPDGKIREYIPPQIEEVFIMEDEEDVRADSEGHEQDTGDRTRENKARDGRTHRHTKANRNNASKNDSTKN